METAGLTEREREILGYAADNSYRGLDLRFEGGPYVSELDALVGRGLLAFEEHGPGYMVSYALTDAGRRALG